MKYFFYLFHFWYCELDSVLKKNYSCEQVYVRWYELNKFFLRVNWHSSEYSALHRCICA